MKPFLSFIFLFISSTAWACTAFQLKTEEGSFIYCRSMEFGYRLNSDLLIVPRQTEFIGSAGEKKEGLRWKSTYGYVGMNQSFAKTAVTDGMNEKGLVVGCLYLPGYAHYEMPDEKRDNQTLAPWELASFLLASCSNVLEVKAVLPTLLVTEQPLVESFILPLHYIVSDATGACITIEYVDGKRNLYENPLGVLTNAPLFPWHLTNLSTYVNLSPVNVPQLELSGFSISAMGQGSGLLGLPGDYTPASRFVRATLFSKWASLPKNAEEGIALGFHLLNTFDIFDGIIRDNSSPKSPTIPNPSPEITQWVVVNDQSHLKSYFRSYESLRIEMVDLNKIDFALPGFRKIPLVRAFQAEDVTLNATPL